MHERLRVLVVTTALVPDQMETWRCAAECGDVDLHLAGSLTHDPSESYLAPLGVPSWGTTHVLAARGLIRRGRLWWRLEGLEGTVAAIRPDVVHVHSEAWGWLVAQSLRCGVPVAAHGAENVSVGHGGRLEARIRAAVTRRNARRLAGYASWNSAGIEVLRSSGLRPGVPVVVAPAIVPSPQPFLGLATRPPGSNPVRIGYLGRLVPEKGVQWLLSAMDGLADVQLVVVGSGPYEDQLRRQADRRGVRAEFTGAVDSSALPGILAGLDVVAVPSVASPGWAEQFGRVVCEAMFAGVPVVSSDSGSLAEVVGDAGVVVPELDHEALRAALLRLIHDEAARAALAERGRTWALSSLGPEAAAKRLVGFWQAVAAA